MHRHHRLLIVLMLCTLLTTPLVSYAQDDSLVPLEGTWTYLALNIDADCSWSSGTTTLEDYAGSEDFAFEFPVYVLDGGERLLFVFEGDDILYTQIGPGTYESTLIGTDPDETYDGLMAVLDEESVQTSAVFSLGDDCTYTYDNAYIFLNDTTAELWTETPRTLTNTSMGECLARTGVAEVWIENDLFVPVIYPDDLSGVLIGTTLYEISERGFEHTSSYTVGDSVQVFSTILEPIDDDTLAVDFLYQIDGRDDCAIAYTSELRRVEDAAALLASE